MLGFPSLSALGPNPLILSFRDSTQRPRETTARVLDDHVGAFKNVPEVLQCGDERRYLRKVSLDQKHILSMGEGDTDDLMLYLDQRCWYEIQWLKVRLVARQYWTPRSNVVESGKEVSVAVLEDD